MIKIEEKITFVELIVELMPFSEELIHWCKTHPEFLVALKIIHSDRFISLGAIVTSNSPNYPEDEVIGMYTYDYQRKTPIFKQDFIINKGNLNKEFVLFTRNSKGRSNKYVKDINEFYTTYGKGGFYTNTHHLTLEQLPGEIRERGQEAINLANRLAEGAKTRPTQEHISRIYKQIREIKKGTWKVKQKLRRY